MKKLRLGIIGTSDIAFRRFLPALQKGGHFTYAGVASRQIEKTQPFIQSFGGKGYANYEELICSDDVDVLYIPLPPALHFEWAKKALMHGKHVLLEKPSTISLKDTQALVAIAKENNLALQENYMFQYHSQLSYVQKVQRENKLGDFRLIRIAFGFPMRGTSDFRYNERLGGGALLDCGGYTVKLATILLGESIKLTASRLNYTNEFDVDLFGSATFENEDGLTAQVSFGMDNAYQCQLEIWGSKQTLIAPRIFTAGDGFKPQIILKSSSDIKTIELESDDQFLNSIVNFYQYVQSDELREDSYNKMELQSKLIESILNVERKKYL